MTASQKTLGTLAIIPLLCLAVSGCVTNPLSLPLSLEITSPEDGAELNVNMLKVSGTISSPEAAVTVNGIGAEVAKDGTFYAYIELREGRRKIKAVATLGAEEVSDTITVTYNPAPADFVTHPLSLEIESPEDGAELNMDPLKVSGTVSDTEATVVVNGIEAKVAEDGTYYAYIELAEGENAIEAVAMRGEERFSEIISVIYSPPPAGAVTDSLSLAINSPKDGAEFKVNVLKVNGTVSDAEATVVVNGIEAKVAEDGTYYAYIELAEGENTIQAVAIRDTAKSSETIAVTFSPALTVYLDAQPEWGIDYTKTPLRIGGSVSHPEATVAVNGGEVEVSEDGSFSTQVQLTEGSCTIKAVATLDEEEDAAVIMYMCSPEGILAPVPGYSRFDDARLFYDDSVVLKAGEPKLLDVTLETRKDGPGEFRCTILYVGKEYSENKLPMPEGLEVSIEPCKVTAYPNTAYHSTIIIKTTSELAPGEYFLLFERSFENAFRGKGWIKVTVAP